MLGNRSAAFSKLHLKLILYLNTLEIQKGTIRYINNINRTGKTRPDNKIDSDFELLD